MAHDATKATRRIQGLFVAAAGITAFAFTTGGSGIGPPPFGTSAEQSSRPGARTANPLPASRPVRVVIPSVGIDAPLTKLALEESGRLASPPDNKPALAGWWADGPAPGTRGTAIIAGHVDVPTGPAVFYNLGALSEGATVDVPRADGSTARFRIDSVDVYDADAFPNDKVYADTGRPELRLITCGGGFDKKRRQYNGNVVVSARLTT